MKQKNHFLLKVECGTAQTALRGETVRVCATIIANHFPDFYGFHHFPEFCLDFCHFLDLCSEFIFLSYQRNTASIRITTNNSVDTDPILVAETLNRMLFTRSMVDNYFTRKPKRSRIGKHTSQFTLP